MSVLYRLHQDQSVGTKRSGKWYARMVPIGMIDTRGLAEIIQRNCTVKRSDVMAVLEELVDTMRDQLQDSKRVKLDGFGQDRHQLPRCPLGQGLHRQRQHRGSARGIHPRAYPRPGGQQGEAVPAGRQCRRAA